MSGAMSDKPLRDEIRAVIQAGLDAGQPMPAKWVVQSVVSTHLEECTTDFTQICAWHTVSTLTNAIVRESRADPAEQLILPGHEQLQSRYTIVRDGDSVIVPLEQCTDVELRTKARELRTHARGCEIHAREIEDYIEERAAAKQVAVAAPRRSQSSRR